MSDLGITIDSQRSVRPSLFAERRGSLQGHWQNEGEDNEDSQDEKEDEDDSENNEEEEEEDDDDEENIQEETMINGVDQASPVVSGSKSRSHVSLRLDSEYK